MIRPFCEQDLEAVMEIWLSANLQAHGFLPETYWRGQCEAVRQQIPDAEVYVFEDSGRTGITGFIGVVGNDVAGLFVREECRSGGIGRRLLDYVKEKKPELVLKVYEKNTRAAAFYEREGFVAVGDGLDTDTHEKERILQWKR